MSKPLKRNAQRASVIAVMTAACIASNYLLIGVVNVKFMDLIVFVSGFSFGPAVGASVGVMTWLIYGTLNPYGFSLPVLITTALGESLYGLVGGVMGAREANTTGISLSANLKFAITGFLLTFVYDLVTNVVSGLSVGIPLNIALLTGIPFAIAHEFSNAAFFFLGATPLIGAIDRLILRRERKMVETKNIWMWATAALLCTTIASSYMALNYQAKTVRLENDYETLLENLDDLTITINLKIDYGEGDPVWHNDTRVPLNANLLEATQLLASVDYTASEYGALVNKIDDIGGDANSYWLWYYLDEDTGSWEYGPVGADQWVLHDGDTVLWEYATF